MTKEEAKYFYPILQAFAEGKVIECRTKPSSLKDSDTPNEWTEMKEFEFWNNTEYRIKPEPKYRPFVNAEECWQEMQKHQPFGWLKLKCEDTVYGMLTLIKDKGAVVGINDTPFCYRHLFYNYTFADGTPFGVKED
jgi:hypothetical protein